MAPGALNSSGSAFGVGMGKGAGKGGKGKNKNKGKHKGADDCVDESKLRFVDGCCCCFTGLMMEDCCGCSMESQLCCLTERCCCKAGQDMLWCTAPKGHICLCGLGLCSIGCINCMGSDDHACSCCAQQVQLCCLVSNGALPPTNEFPCLIGMCGLSCYPEFGCCEKIKKIDGGATKAA